MADTSTVLCPPHGQFFTCGHGSYTCLPCKWQGSYTLAVVVPQFILHTKTQIISRLHNSPSPSHSQISHRGIPGALILTGLGFFSAISMEVGGIRMDSDLHTQLSYKFKTSIYDTSKTEDSLQDQRNSLDSLVFQNRWVLDVLVAESGGTCAILGEECCCFVNKPGTVKNQVKKLQELVGDIE